MTGRLVTAICRKYKIDARFFPAMHAFAKFGTIMNKDLGVRIRYVTNYQNAITELLPLMRSSAE